MYNMLHGVNPLSDIILAMLDLKRADIPRFRDVHFHESKIAVYTRLGGNNRECWNSQWGAVSKSLLDEGWTQETCTCPGCWISRTVAEHPSYLSDSDDDFDSTYATVYFSIPKEWNHLIELTKEMKWRGDDEWDKTFKRLNAKGPTDKEIEAFRPVMDQIMRALK